MAAPNAPKPIRMSRYNKVIAGRLKNELEPGSEMILLIAMGSFGSSQSYIDLKTDLDGVVFAGLKLSSAATIEDFAYTRAKPYLVEGRLSVRVHRPDQALAILDEIAPYYRCEPGSARWEHVQCELMDLLSNDTDEILRAIPPYLADEYREKQMLSVDEFCSEEDNEEQRQYYLDIYPEWTRGFCKSAHSLSLGGDVYFSSDQLLVSGSIDPGRALATWGCLPPDAFKSLPESPVRPSDDATYYITSTPSGESVRTPRSRYATAEDFGIHLGWRTHHVEPVSARVSEKMVVFSGPDMTIVCFGN